MDTVMMPKFSQEPIRTRARNLTIAAMIVAVSGLSYNALGQNRELSLADILIALRSKKAVIEEKNKILAEAVKQRGITFSLTAEIEKELDGTGAQPTLIAAIREKAPQPKVETKVEPAAEMPPVEPAVILPDPEPSPAPPDFAFYRTKATQALKANDLDAAIFNLNKATELKPADATAFADRGVIYIRREDHLTALQELTKAIELDPKDSLSRFNRGMVLERLGKTDEALVDFEKATELDPSDEPAKNAVARIRKAKSDAEEAAAAAKAAAIKAAMPEPALPPDTVVNVGAMNEYATDLAMPVYPDFERKARIQGTVTVLINLDSEGKITQLQCTTGPRSLCASAEKAVKRSQFKPVMRNGRAVAASGTISFNFKL